MIRLRQLVLENFLSHKNTVLSFDDEAYVILGENASGKTSILRGIFFALFGKDFVLDNKNISKIVNRESNKMSVSLTFVYRKNTYTIRRKYSVVRKKSEAELEKDGKLCALGVKNVKEFIENELGLDPNIFRNTVYVPQGEISKFFEVARKEKRQILNRLLGLEEIGEKHEKVKSVLNKLKSIEKLFLDKKESFKELEEETKKIEAEIEKISTLLDELEKEKEKEFKLLDSQENLLNRYLRKREEYKKLTESKRRLEEQLKKSIEELNRLNKKIEEIKKLESIVPQLEGKLKTLFPLKKIKAILEVVVEKKGEKEKLKAVLNEIKFIEGEIKEIFKKRRMRKGIKKLSNHYIVCGYGRMGEIICEELKTNNVPFVVVDKNEEMLKEREDILYIIGDATKDEILKEAGIERAKGIVSVLSTDAENLYVVLSARAMNPKLFIVARAAEEEAKNKLKIAGADRVVCPYHIGGLRIAQTLLRPNVVDFLEFVTRSEYLDIQIEEIEVSSKASFVGKSLGEAGIGKDLGVIIVGIKRADGRMEFNPSARTVINSGDILIVIGPRERLAFLTEIAAGED